VMSLVARGRSNQQIARALGISDHAVKRHVSNLLMKFHCSNRTEIALLAHGRQPVGPPLR
jgi:DNA-binding NarL/FixJ family response regulator